ncbi:MAG: hypothetical protein PVH00_01755 [Gemmatimonadota bacterium]
MERDPGARSLVARPGSGAAGRLIGSLIAIAAGGFIVAIALDVIHAPPESFHAPRWVVAAAGSVFVLAGILLLAGDGDSGFRRFMVAVLVTVFALPFDWVAFGPGPREFSGSAGVGGVGVAGRVGELSGRVVFGIGAVVLDLLALFAWIRFLRRLARNPASPP